MVRHWYVLKQFAPDGPPGGAPIEPPKTEDAPKTEPPAANPAEEKKFSQAELERVLTERLEREKKKQDAAAQKAKEDAEAAAAEAAKEFEKLANTRKTKVEQLEAEKAELAKTAERVTTLEALVKAHVDKERQELPAHIVSLLDALPVEGQYQWLVANGAAAKAKTPDGVPVTPKPGDPKSLNNVEKQRRAVGVRQIW